MPQLDIAQGSHCTHVITCIRVAMPGRGTPARRALLISRRFQNLALAGFLVGSWSDSSSWTSCTLGSLARCAASTHAHRARTVGWHARTVDKTSSPTTVKATPCEQQRYGCRTLGSFCAIACIRRNAILEGAFTLEDAVRTCGRNGRRSIARNESTHEGMH